MDVVNRVTSADGTSIAFERAGAGPPLITVDAAGNYRDFRPSGRRWSGWQPTSPSSL
jgi:hypothetical protein